MDMLSIKGITFCPQSIGFSFGFERTFTEQIRQKSQNPYCGSISGAIIVDAWAPLTCAFGLTVEVILPFLPSVPCCGPGPLHPLPRHPVMTKRITSAVHIQSYLLRSNTPQRGAPSVERLHTQHALHDASSDDCEILPRTVWHTYEIEKGQNIIKNFKRHSDGTFTNDFTHYLDKIKAKDFVEWLTSNSRVGGVERQVGEYMEIHGKVCSAFPLLENSSCLPHVNRLHGGQRWDENQSLVVEA
ncbi:unnamed protein product [Arctogadus glacialis]